MLLKVKLIWKPRGNALIRVKLHRSSSYKWLNKILKKQSD
jgi:hypothetical protein